MITKIDIYRTANLMIRQYGDRAVEESYRRAESFSLNPIANMTWKNIASAIKQLLDTDNQGKALN